MNMLARLSLAGAALAGGFLLLAVCIHDPGAPVKVRGWVLADGMPVGGATVFLVPDSLSAVGSVTQKLPLPATTDSLGRYQLPAGAPPGTYRVIVKGFVDDGISPNILSLGDESLDEGQVTAAAMSRVHSPNRTGNASAGQMRQPLPAQYSSAEQTSLRLVVPKGGLTNAEINLTLTHIASNSVDTISH
jgi:hypothetical protein